MDRHRIEIKGGPHGFQCTVTLDGRAIRASRVDLNLDAREQVTAVITLPAVLLHLDLNAITSFVAPVKAWPAPYDREVSE